jgi:hypothetical protein
MKQDWVRRDFLSLMRNGGVVFASMNEVATQLTEVPFR